MIMEQSESIFDRDASRYDNWFDENPFLFETEISVLRMAIESVENGIEIGIGTGRFADMLGITLGVDPSRSMLMHAQERGITVVQAIGEGLPFYRHTFELCLLTTAVCFLTDVAATLSEIYRILRPGGRVVIGMIDSESWLGKKYQKRPKKESFYSEAVFHTPHSIGEKVKKAGFLPPKFLQTLFKNNSRSDCSWRIESGFGDGGFVVIIADKEMD